MPLDPQTLSDLLRQSDQPQTIDNVQSPQPTQPPAPIPPSQQTDTPAPQPESTKLLLKPSQSSTPASLQDMMLQGAYAASNGPGMTIPTFKDDTSPARSILSNMFLGMGASLTGQKFQSIQERKYQRYLDNVKLNLEQQQRNQQLQIGMTNAVAKMTKDQNNTAFRNRVEDIKQETDATKLAFKKAQFETQTGLDWAKFAQQDQRFQDLSRHMNNQDSQAAINHNPQIKDSDYLRAVALTQAKYGSQGLDPSDSQVYPKFLQDVEDTTMAIKAQQAQMKPAAQLGVDTRNDKSYQFNSSQLDKYAKPVSDLQTRMGRLQDSIGQNTPQADALIAPELLSVMAGGAGSGLRMNEAEISRIVGGRSKWEDLKASVQKWQRDPSKANSITSDQRGQIRALVQTVQSRVNTKQQVIDDARSALAGTDDPERHRRIVVDAQKKLAEADGAVPHVTTQQQYDSLPSGASYIGPNGNQARKP